MNPIKMLGLGLAIAISGCATPTGQNELNQIARDSSYFAFKIPREKDATAAIISIVNDEETLLASPDAPLSQCLVSSIVPRSRRKIAFANVSSDVDSKATADLNLNQFLESAPQFNVAANRSRAKSFTVEFDQPFEEVISAYSVIEYRRSLAEDSLCSELMSRSDSLLVHSAIGAEGLRFSFYDERGNLLKIDAEIPIGAPQSAGWSVSNLNQESLVYAGQVYFGFRAWSASEVPGFLGDELELETAIPEGMEVVPFEVQ